MNRNLLSHAVICWFKPILGTMLESMGIACEMKDGLKICS